MKISYYLARFLKKTIGSHYLVFICYATVNEAKAVSIKNMLESHGAFPFMSGFDLEPGDVSIQVIEANIKNCDLFVPILTKQSVKRVWVQNEIGYAKALGKQIFPLITGEEKKIKKNLGIISDLNYWRYNDTRLEKKLKSKVHIYLLKQFVIIFVVIGFVLYQYLKNRGIRSN